jgi:hypothetical protein
MWHISIWWLSIPSLNINQPMPINIVFRQHSMISKADWDY